MAKTINTLHAPFDSVDLRMKVKDVKNESTLKCCK